MCAGRSETSRQTGPSVRSSPAIVNLSIHLLAGRDQHVGKLRQQLAAKRRAPRGSPPSRSRPVRPNRPRRARSSRRSGCSSTAPGRERVQQQLAPRFEKHGPIVELNAQHVGLGRLFGRQQIVANLLAPCAQVVAAVAQLRQHLAADHARIGRPDLAVLWIDDARILLGFADSRPSDASRRPRRWATVRRSRRGAASAREWSRRCGPGRRPPRSSAPASRSGSPAASPLPAWRPTSSWIRPMFTPSVSWATQRSARGRSWWSLSTIGPQIVETTSSVASGSPLTLMVSLECSNFRGPSGVLYESLSVGSTSTITDVGPVSFAIGESPGHVAVAAHDHGRRAGQRDAGDAVQRWARRAGLLSAGCGALLPRPAIRSWRDTRCAARECPGACRRPPAPGRPWFACRPPPSCCCPRETSFPRPSVPGGASSATSTCRGLRVSNTSGPGISGTVNASPCIGASQRVPLGHRKANISGPSRS